MKNRANKRIWLIILLCVGLIATSFLSSYFVSAYADHSCNDDCAICCLVTSAGDNLKRLTIASRNGSAISVCTMMTAVVFVGTVIMLTATTLSALKIKLNN